MLGIIVQSQPMHNQGMFTRDGIGEGYVFSDVYPKLSLGFYGRLTLDKGAA